MRGGIQYMGKRVQANKLSKQYQSVTKNKQTTEQVSVREVIAGTEHERIDKSIGMSSRGREKQQENGVGMLVFSAYEKLFKKKVNRKRSNNIRATGR